MDFQLTAEQKGIQETVRKFARAEVAPRAEELDRTGEFPYDLVKKCADIGIQGILFPEELGGIGGDLITWVVAIEELARGDASLAVTILTPESVKSDSEQVGMTSRLILFIISVFISISDILV